jgi:hypothetical protein
VASKTTERRYPYFVSARELPRIMLTCLLSQNDAQSQFNGVLAQLKPLLVNGIPSYLHTYVVRNICSREDATEAFSLPDITAYVRAAMTGVTWNGDLRKPAATPDYRNPVVNPDGSWSHKFNPIGAELLRFPNLESCLAAAILTHVNDDARIQEALRTVIQGKALVASCIVSALR